MKKKNKYINKERKKERKKERNNLKSIIPIKLISDLNYHCDSLLFFQ